MTSMRTHDVTSMRPPDMTARQIIQFQFLSVLFGILGTSSEINNSFCFSSTGCMLTFLNLTQHIKKIRSRIKADS